MGDLRVLGREGDLKTVWDVDKPAEVEAAKKTFNELKTKGYLAYAVQEGGAKGIRLFDFDPKRNSIILAPPMTGG